MQEFSIAPAGLRPLWALVPALLVIGVVLMALVPSVIGSRRAVFAVGPDGLRLRGDWYGRLIPARALVADRARHVDFEETPELAPTRRTLGTGLPGYQAGWFRLRGGEKALLYLTDRRRAVYVPTREGYAVIVSPADPDGFLGALRALGGPAGE